MNAVLALGAFLAWVPSVTFGLLKADIFPWAFIFALLLNRSRRFFGYLFLLVVTSLPAVLLGLYNAESWFEFSRSYVAFFNAIILFFFIFTNPSVSIKTLAPAIKSILLLQVIISLTQFFGWDSVFQFFVPRSGDAGGARGFTGMSNEPGRQGIHFILLYSTIFFLDRGLLKYKIYLDVLVFSFMFLINKSLTGILFFSIYFVLTSSLKTSSFIFLSFAVLLGVLIAQVELDSRILGFFLRVLLEPEEWFRLLFDFSGFRFSSVLIVFENISILGGGVGAWREAISEALNSPGLVESFLTDRQRQVLMDGVRPTSLLAGLFLEGGGLLVFCWVSICILCATKERQQLLKTVKGANLFESVDLSTVRLVRGSVFLSLLSLGLIGSIGSPVASGTLALSALYSTLLLRRQA